MERLVALRTPVAVIALVAAAAMVAAGFGYAITLGDPAPLLNAGPTLTLALSAVFVTSTWLPPTTKSARWLAVAGVAVAVVLMGSQVMALVTNVARWSTPMLIVDAVAVIVLTAVPLLIFGALLLPASQREAKPVSAPSVGAGVAVPERADAEPKSEPTWAADGATAVVWQRASDAASGEAATGYGTAAARGWEPPEDVNPAAHDHSQE